MIVVNLEKKNKQDVLDLLMTEIEEILLIAKMKNYNGTIKFNRSIDSLSFNLSERDGKFSFNVYFLSQDSDFSTPSAKVEYTEKYSCLDKFKKKSKDDFWEEHNFSNGRCLSGFIVKSAENIFEIVELVKKFF
jgi:hypothetical protein